MQLMGIKSISSIEVHDSFIWLCGTQLTVKSCDQLADNSKVNINFVSYFISYHIFAYHNTHLLN